jgi:hypothetical protein
MGNNQEEPTQMTRRVFSQIGRLVVVVDRNEMTVLFYFIKMHFYELFGLLCLIIIGVG